MFLSRAWKNWKTCKSSNQKPRPTRSYRPQFEVLEDRCVPATDTVTNLMDGASVAGSLRAVLASAAPGDTVVFQSGLTGTLTLTNGALTISQAVTIQGPGPNVITISGGGASQIFNDTAAVGTSATITGLTLTGGAKGVNGGAVYDDQANLTLTNVVITGNSCTTVGGGVAVSNSGTLTIQNSTISSNTSGTAGGGVGALDTSTLVIMNSTITINTATAGKGGGGVYSFNGANPGPNVTIQSSTISKNVATGGTGGGTWTAGSLTITQSTISGNSTVASGKAGGGILLFGTTTVVLIQDSTIYGNTATGNGGGINGGGTTSVTIQNCTIADNISTTGVGGGFNTAATPTGAVTIQSTIIAGNMANGAANDLNNASATVNASNDLIQTTPTGAAGINGTNTANLIGMNPMLGPLQNNGGPTFTMALLSGSPALGTGSNPANLATDQRGTGFLRTVNGKTDIGAFETQAGNTIYAVGADAGGGPEVSVYNASTNALIASFFAFTPTFTGGVRVAVDVINGIDDIICAAGPGGGPQVTIYNGSMLNQVQSNGTLPASAIVASFFAFAPTFTGGIFLAAGTSSSGQNWVAAAAGAGGGPQVVVWTVPAILAGAAAGTAPTPLISFFAFAPTFTGGVTVALGDVLGTGKLDVIAGAGPGGGPQVVIVDGTKFSQIASSGINSALISSFEAFLPTFAGGVYVSGGIFNGQFDVIVGPGTGGGPQVILINGSMTTQVASNGTIAPTAILDSFFATTSTFTGGVRVGYNAQFAASSSSTPGPVVLTGAGPGGGPQVSIFGGSPTLAALSEFFAEPLGFNGGLFIAG